MAGSLFAFSGSLNAGLKTFNILWKSIVKHEDNLEIISKNAGIPLYIIENYVKTVKKINCKKTENNGPQAATSG